MQDNFDTERSQAGDGGAILSVSVAADSFGKTWAHCGQLVDYMGRYAGIHNEDAKRGAMMFAAVFNGVLEAIAKHHTSHGSVKIRLRQGAGAIELWADVPVAQEQLPFYTEVQDLVRKADLREWYLGQIARGAADIDPALLGIAELATTFRSQIKVSRNDAGTTVTLTVVFPLSEMEES